MRKVLVAVFIVAFIGVLFLVKTAGAVEIPNPLRYDTFEELLYAIIRFLRMIATAVAPLMIIIAGFNFVTAAGDPAKIKRAKDIITYTAVGVGIVLLAEGLIAVLKSILGVTE